MIIAFFVCVYTIVVLSILVYDSNQIRKNKKDAKKTGYISASIFSAISLSIIALIFVLKKICKSF